MNNYQQFAVNHYLSQFNDEFTFQDVLDALHSGWKNCVTVNEAYKHLSSEELADDIDQMAYTLEQTF
jgi:hypothetical protein